MAPQLTNLFVENLMLRLFVVALISSAAIANAQQGAALANGVFLVAKPPLVDPQFQETVVLITELEAGSGPIGVIINRPLDATLSGFMRGKRIPEKFDHIYAGGPIARTQLLFLVRSRHQPPNSVRVLPDVYLSGDRDLFDAVMDGKLEVTAFRAYAGYAGWVPGQLQVEIASGGWYIVQADADTIFSADPVKTWPELIRRAAQQYTHAPAESQKLSSLTVK